MHRSTFLVIFFMAASICVGVACRNPRKSQVAFVSNRDGDADIYIMNSDGTGQKPLTQNSD